MPAYLQPLCEYTGLPIMHVPLAGTPMHHLEVAEFDLLHLRGQSLAFDDIRIGVICSDILIMD